MTYSETTPTHPSTQIVVYSLNNKVNAVNSALSSYQLTHPDVYFKHIIGTSGDLSEEEAISALNTELLSQQGPDILILDGLPYEGYAIQKIFAPLNEMLNSIDKSESLFLT